MLTLDQALDDALADALHSPGADPLTALDHTYREIAAALRIAEPTG